MCQPLKIPDSANVHVTEQLMALHILYLHSERHTCDVWFLNFLAHSPPGIPCRLGGVGVELLSEHRNARALEEEVGEVL
jgi:hypothetical protein